MNNLEQYIYYITTNGEKQCFSYHQYPWLREWMIQNTKLDQGDNLVEVILTRDNLEDLYVSCERVMTKYSQPEIELPSPGGVYGEYYFQQVDYVHEDIEKLLGMEEELLITTYQDWY